MCCSFVTLRNGPNRAALPEQLAPAPEGDICWFCSSRSKAKTSGPPTPPARGPALPLGLGSLLPGARPRGQGRAGLDSPALVIGAAVPAGLGGPGGERVTGVDIQGPVLVAPLAPGRASDPDPQPQTLPRRLAPPLLLRFPLPHPSAVATGTSDVTAGTSATPSCVLCTWRQTDGRASRGAACL